MTDAMSNPFPGVSTTSSFGTPFTFGPAGPTPAIPEPKRRRIEELNKDIDDLKADNKILKLELEVKKLKEENELLKMKLKVK